MRAPVVEDQKWIVWSEEPPPVARRLDCQGHHASAWASFSMGSELDEGLKYLYRGGVVPLCPFGCAARNAVAGLQYGLADATARTSFSIQYRAWMFELRAHSLPAVHDVVIPTTRQKLPIRSPSQTANLR